MVPFNASLQRDRKTEVKRRMGPPQRQSVAQISKEFGIHVATLYNWRHNWRLQGEVVPASAKDPEGWSAADKFTLVLETTGLNATELSAYCRERWLFPPPLPARERNVWTAVWLSPGFGPTSQAPAQPPASAFCMYNGEYHHRWCWPVLSGRASSPDIEAK